MEVGIVILFELFALHCETFQLRAINVLLELLSNLLRVEGGLRFLLRLCLSLLVLFVDLSLDLVRFLVVRDEILYFDRGRIQCHGLLSVGTSGSVERNFDTVDLGCKTSVGRDEVSMQSMAILVGNKQLSRGRPLGQGPE